MKLALLSFAMVGSLQAAPQLREAAPVQPLQIEILDVTQNPDMELVMTLGACGRKFVFTAPKDIMITEAFQLYMIQSVEKSCADSTRKNIK